MRQEIRFAGFGGQGIILCGYIAAKAAALYDKKNVVMTQSYGPEARGGACSANVVISDEFIDYPKVVMPQVNVIMSQDAYRIYKNEFNPDTVLIVDADLVNIERVVFEKLKVHKIPATKLAEKMGKRVVANIVMLGFFVKATDIIRYSSVKKAVETSVPKGTEKLNLKAFETGYNYTSK
jgi:2-oxoglutarate ferredoxin oxidoreductase subunit gamma